jgi:hypothetical protein
MKCKYCGGEFSDNVGLIHQRKCKQQFKKKAISKIDIKEYHIGGGWYDYDGKSYRKEEFKKIFGAGVNK